MFQQVTETAALGLLSALTVAHSFNAESAGHEAGLKQCSGDEEMKNRIVEDASRYATREDFCKLFAEELNGLYLLSFLMTADDERAEQCFVAGLEDCVKANCVFRKWAHLWAKRTIIRTAIRTSQPRPDCVGSALPTKRSLPNLRDGHFDVESMMALKDFDRSVFVMSVLEQYSELECALLLGCSRKQIQSARIWAFEQIGDSGWPISAREDLGGYGTDQVPLAAGA